MKLNNFGSQNVLSSKGQPTHTLMIKFTKRSQKIYQETLWWPQIYKSPSQNHKEVEKTFVLSLLGMLYLYLVSN